MRYIVAALKDGKVDHYASVAYDRAGTAEQYMLECRRLCAPETGFTYEVMELP